MTNGLTSLEVRLVNKTTSIVVAWKLMVDYTLSDGRSERVGIIRDAYVSTVPGLDTGAIPALSESTETVPLAIPERLRVESARPAVEMLVFEDGTWSGEPWSAQAVFEQRRRDEAAWTLIAESLRLGQAAGGRNGLEIALAHLIRSDQTDFDNAFKIMIRQNLQRGLTPLPTTKLSSDDFLRIWVERATARVNAAAAHKISKGPRTTK